MWAKAMCVTVFNNNWLPYIQILHGKIKAKTVIYSKDA